MEIFQLALEHAIELVMYFGADGEIKYVNRSAKEQLEYGEELIGKNIRELLPVELTGQAESLESLLQLLKAKEEIMIYRKNQICFPVQLKVVQLTQTPAEYLFMGIDTTNKLRLTKQARQAGEEAMAAQKMKNEFVANVTHELRTPVNGILGNTKELLETVQDEKDVQKLRMIERGCKDMNALINNILDFSKLEAGKFVLEKRKFHFREMIDYVKANHRSKIVEKGLGFFVTVSPDIPDYIVGDELRIVQILNNLLSNACKFTSVGKITLEVVKTVQEDNRMELFFLVLDTGIGIDKEGQDKLFKSFSQVDASISRRYGGTGLGLNISKQLVEMMDGKIRVQSELHKGTMFSFHIWVELPKEDERIEAEKAVTGTVYRPTSVEEVFAEDALREFGTKENTAELKKKMRKLILALEMENWEKSEMFMVSIKELTDSAPQEIKKNVLRLKMAVQKGAYEKAVAAYEVLEKELGYGER